MKLDVVELFAGVGGFRVGLNHIKEFDKETGRAIENKKWNFVWASQWEPSTKAQPAFDCYVTRFGNENHSNEDINLVNKKTIPDHTLLVGGFPCQDYSVARTKSNELGMKGKKGVLWWDIVDILFEKKTPFILLENVDRLLKSPAKQRGRDFAVMLKTLDELGYIVQWRVINAGEYGMPQRRRRVFIFAVLKNTPYARRVINTKDKEEYLINDGFFNDIFDVKRDEIKIKHKSLEEFADAVEVSDNYKGGMFLKSGLFYDNKIINFDAIENSSDKTYTLGQVIKNAKKYHKGDFDKYIVEGKELDKWEYLKGAKKIPRVKPNGEQYFYSEGKMSFPDSLSKPGRTMLTSESSINRSSHIVYDKEIDAIRKITEIEAELLQTFPANWTDTGMTSRQRYFMMGNALVTEIVGSLEKKIEEIISE